MQATLRNNEESGLYAVVGDAVPHHTGFPARDGMLERDHLTGVQRRIFVNGAKSALAVIEQAAHDLLRRGVVKRECQGSLPAVAAFGPSING